MEKQISTVLREKRNEKGVSVEHVAQKLKELGIKVSPKTIYNWETGHSQPNPDTLLALCEIYQITDVLETFGYKGKFKEPDNIVETLTLPEQNHIKKYRVLDEHGKAAVDSILTVEHERAKRLEQERKENEILKNTKDDDIIVHRVAARGNSSQEIALTKAQWKQFAEWVKTQEDDDVSDLI